MSLPDYRSLVLERDGLVLTVRLNRPEAMNALTDDVQDELLHALAAAAADSAVNVVVLTGAGKAFSAGGDLKAMRAALDDPQHFANTIPRAKELVFRLLDFGKPLIAKINGHAIGLGATLALLCDVTFADETARLIDPHVQIGLVAGDGGSLLWPQLIGINRAKEYLFTGEPLLASDAARLGLINHAVPATELDARVRAFAQKVARQSARAVQGTKTTVNLGVRALAQSVMDAGMAYETITSRSHDHREAVLALLEKRQPNFTGS